MKMIKKFSNKKLGVSYKTVNGFIPRIYWRKIKEKQSLNALVKCGDCQNKFEIFFGEDSLEINGVLVDTKWFMELIRFGCDMDSRISKKS